ncbi:MAG TPA: LCP family protein [Solirubrobacteraceae bacterium]|nr:LCP family protein [Solirubrobacteraceae bacterium]
MSDRPPRVGFSLAWRALLACLLVLVITAAAVATAALRELDDILDPIRKPGRADIEIPELDTPPPGGPRTFMILGSDKREGADRFSPPRSDTILLARADPNTEAITVLSIPRDLKVDIPGHGKNKINAAFELGGRKQGPALVVRTIKKLFRDQTGENFPITNVMVMDYGAFRRAVNYIDGVYVDIDRDYFNDNSSGENYATIDVDPGYQKLKGKDALDYVRYRHGDNDLVRAARQQDFLRQAKNAAGVRQLLSGGLGESRHLIQVFSRYFRVDKSLRSNKQVLSLLKLAIYLSAKNPKVTEVSFPAYDAPNPQLDSNLYVKADDLRKVYRRFMSLDKAAEPPKDAPEETTSSTSGGKRKREKASSETVAGLEDTRREGEDLAVLADPKLKFPFYFPTVRAKGSSYSGPEQPRIYKLKDETGKKQQAYRLVLRAPGIGEYYGIQGMTWKAPPILDDPDRTVRDGNRKLRLYYDGQHLRLVAWKTNKGVYWVSNTLTQSIGNAQMLEIAGSLRRLKQ